MTLTIHRQVRLQRLTISLALAAILAIVAFATFQTMSTEPADAPAADMPAVIAETESAGYWLKLQSLQDNYLPPTAAAESDGYWQKLQSLQDNYLPPTAASQPGVDPNGLTDNRTAGPR